MVCTYSSGGSYAKRKVARYAAVRRATGLGRAGAIVIINRARWVEVSRYRDNIETFSFNVAGGYLIVEFNKMVKPGAGNADLSRRSRQISIYGILFLSISIRMYFCKIIDLIFCVVLLWAAFNFVAKRRQHFSLKFLPNYTFKMATC